MDEWFYFFDSSYLVDYVKKVNFCGDEIYFLEMVDIVGGFFFVVYREKYVLFRFNVFYVCYFVMKILKWLFLIVGMVYELILLIFIVDYFVKIYKVICIGE